MASAALTPKERVFRRLKGESVDKIPNLNIIMAFTANYISVPYSKYVTDFRYLVEGNIKSCDRFGIDMVSAISDPFRESSGFGADIIFPEDDVPKCTNYLIKDYTQLKNLKPVDPSRNERMQDRVNAVAMYKKEVGDRYPILGWVEGPFAEANDLRGMSQIMTDIFDEPESLRELLEICLEQAVMFAAAQVRAGADFIGVGDAAASLVGPRLYEDFVLPYEKRLIDRIHNEGAKVKLHICGNITSILDLLPQSGADMIDVDWMVDFRKANESFAGKCCACGNFDPVEVLLRGSVDDVKNAVKKCLGEGNTDCIIAAGCEVPKHTPHENLDAVNEMLYL